jgi:ATP-dependent Clp protease ATP-binding subunit ClpA
MKKRKFISLITSFALMLSLCTGILMMDRAQAQSNLPANAKARNSARVNYVRDLTALARERKLEVVKGREASIRAVVEILSRTEQNNPVLISESGLNSTALVEEIAQRIVAGNVPANLQHMSSPCWKTRKRRRNWKTG